MRGETRSKGFLTLIIFLGAIGGSLIGDALGNNFKSLQFLRSIYSIGVTKPFFVDLKILNLTLGFNFNLSIMSIVGVILAIILFRKH